MPRSSVQIEGLPKLDAALRVRAALLHAAAVVAVTVEAREVRADAAGGAPKDTGELRGSIIDRRSGTSAQVMATARHAEFQEFGTSRHPAQPYMGPAAERSRTRFRGRVALAVRRAVR